MYEWIALRQRCEALRTCITDGDALDNNKSKLLHLIERAQHEAKPTDTHKMGCWGGMVEADELTETEHDAL